MSSEYSNSEPIKLSKSSYTILCHKIIPLYLQGLLFQSHHISIEQMNYSVRHSLNMEQMKDMLKLIKHLCPDKSYCIDNAVEIINIIVTDLQTVFFDQCEICVRIFPEEYFIHPYINAETPHCNAG